MASDILLHDATAAAIENVLSQPPHALLITGQTGTGKMTVARHIARQLLHLPAAELDSYPYLRLISPIDGKAIAIETVRELQPFLTLKVPGRQAVSRLVVIEQAHFMTTEAQNSLLKTLEEPPLNTVIILTASSPDAMLVTIQSRVRQLPVTTPAISQTREYFTTQGFSGGAIDKTMLMSGGLPGLTHALLTEPENHPLYAATVQAREILRASNFERLALVDGLSKQKQLCSDTLFILMQMARMSLMRQTGEQTKAAERWQSVLTTAYGADQALRANTQAKLVLTDLMLNV